MFRLAGLSDPEARATRVLALETAIAKQQLSLADSEDIHKANNPWHPADFTAKAPGLDWPEFFTRRRPRQTGCVHRLAAIRLHRRSRPRRLTAHRRLERSPRLPPHREPTPPRPPKPSLTSASPSSAPRSPVATQQRPRDFRARALVSATLGDAVGQIYVKRFFPPEAKAQVEAIVANLIAAFHARLENITWMAPATKKEALTKLGTLKVSIGYPDHWRSYAAYEVTPDNLFANLWNASLFEYHYSLSRIGKPADRTEWCMEPADRQRRQPSARQQPQLPRSHPAAALLRSQGPRRSQLRRHRHRHRPRDQPHLRLRRSRLRLRWVASATGGRPKTSPISKTVTSALAAQYDTYDTLPRPSRQRQPGPRRSHRRRSRPRRRLDAFHASLKGNAAPKVANFTGDQQFFIAFGQNWGSVTRDAALRQQVLTDPHAPGQYRALTVRNEDGWYTAFDIQPTDKLYLAPKDRVRIW